MRLHLERMLTACSTCFDLAIIQEREPGDMYLRYLQDRVQSAGGSSQRSLPEPESPLYCPNGEYRGLLGSNRCSKDTLELVCLLRDLTDTFLDLHAGDSSSNDPVPGQHTSYGPIRASQTPEKRNVSQTRLRDLVSTILQRLAHPHTVQSTNADNIYETVRLTARLYANALWRRVPFSIAAEQDPLTHARLPNSSDVTPGMIKRSLTRTDLSECWQDVACARGRKEPGMMGVLFWVGLVAAAAYDNYPEQKNLEVSRPSPHSNIVQNLQVDRNASQAYSWPMPSGPMGHIPIPSYRTHAFSEGLSTSGSSSSILGRSLSGSPSRSETGTKRDKGKAPAYVKPEDSPPEPYLLQEPDTYINTMTSSGAPAYTTSTSGEMSYITDRQIPYTDFGAIPSNTLAPQPQRPQSGIGQLHAQARMQETRAAPTPTRQESTIADKDHTRRWLVAGVVRCSILLRFDHTIAVMTMLDKMTRVQRILRNAHRERQG